MNRDKEFFLVRKGYTFLCEYIKEKYPDYYCLIWFGNAGDVLKECNKNASN